MEASRRRQFFEEGYLVIREAVHEELKPDAESPPDFESGPLRRFHCNMPEGLGIDEFVDSW